MAILSKEAAGADKMELVSVIFVIFMMSTFSLRKNPHLILNVVSSIMYRMLNMQ